MAAGELKQIGQYEVRGILGKGGMATVYRAYQHTLDREVAIKVMASQFAGDSTFLERFKREARAIGSLRHPNILAIYDFGQDGATPYIVSELLDGKTLRERMGKPFDMKTAYKIINQIASALDYAHRHNIVHRDVKPSNILMGDNNRAVLSDFGIVKMMQDSSSLTGTGMSIGTPDYMSPEQGSGEGLDGRSDQYSLGVILYEMLTGVTPFRGDTPLSVLMGHINRPLPDPRQYNPDLNEQVVEVLKKALSKNREQRYATTGEFAEAFEKAITAPPPEPTRTVSSAAATMVESLSPQQMYDFALTQEKTGNFQSAYNAFFELQQKYPNFADVTQKLGRYQQMNYRFTATTPAIGQGTGGYQSAAPTEIGGIPATPATATQNQNLATAPTEMRPYSGAPVTQQQYTPTPPGSYSGQYPAVQKKPNSGLIILGVVGALAVAAVITLVIILVAGGNKPNPTPVANATATATGTTAVTTTQPVSTTPGTTTTAPVTTTPPVTTTGPNDPAAQQVKTLTGKLYGGQADFKTTVDGLRNLVKQNPNSWLAHRELGIILYLWNIEGGEVDVLNKAVTLNEKDAKSHAYLAMVFHDGYQFDKSLAESTRAIELDPNDPDARAAYSMTLSVAGGDRSRVRTEAKKALDLDPQALWPRWASFLASEKPEEAFEHLDFLINKFPNMATFYSAKGGTFSEQGDYNNAKIWYDQALAIEPRYPYAHAGLGWMYYNQGKYDDAEKSFRASLATNDSYDSSHAGLGFVLNAKGSYDQALDHLKRAVQINPRSATAFNGMSYSYLIKGDNATDTNVRNQYYNQAIENADNALKYLTNYDDARFNKGRALYSLGKYVEAEPLLKQTVEKRPDVIVYRITLAYNYYAQKKYNESRTEAQTILKQLPDYQRAQKLLEDIKKVTGI